MKIKLTTDVHLKGPVWAKVIDNLVGSMFDTNWDLFSLCISIGMMYDEQVDSDALVSDGYDAEPRYVPRTMLGHAQNIALLEFMLQCALVTTKHLGLSEDERLELAFGEKSTLEFKPILFLTEFANAGVLKLIDLISDSDSTETMENIMTFLETAYSEGVNVIDTTIHLED